MFTLALIRMIRLVLMLITMLNDIDDVDVRTINYDIDIYCVALIIGDDNFAIILNIIIDFYIDIEFIINL